MDRNPKLANNKLIDNNKIGQLLFIKYFIKILKFMIIIMNISFILGMCWLILCKFVEDFVQGVHYFGIFEKEDNNIHITGLLSELAPYANTFMVKYELFDLDPWKI